jgi:hypothetical protein
MISTLKVLNTVTALGTDVSVGSDGILNIASGAIADAYNVRNVAISTSVSENAGVITITPSAVASTLYTFYIAGFSKSTGTPKTLSVSFTSAASTDATAISNQAKAIISGTSYDPDFSVTADAAGTGTIVLTAAAGYPFFTVGGTTASITSISGTGATTIFTNISAANGTTGRIGAGLGSSLQAKYAYAAAGNALIYSELANLTPTSYYTEVVIDYLGTGYSGSGAFRGEISTNQAVVLVLFGTSAQGSGAASTSTITNYSDLFGTYGTITGLQSGYRVVGSALTTAIAAGALNSTTQVQTVTGALSSVDVVGGDYLVSISTPVISKVLGTLSNTTYVSSNTTALTSGSYLNLFKWRSFPL